MTTIQLDLDVSSALRAWSLLNKCQSEERWCPRSVQSPRERLLSSPLHCRHWHLFDVGISLMWQWTSCGMKKQFPVAISGTIDFRWVRRRFQSFIVATGYRTWAPEKVPSEGLSKHLASFQPEHTEVPLSSILGDTTSCFLLFWTSSTDSSAIETNRSFPKAIKDWRESRWRNLKSWYLSMHQCNSRRKAHSQQPSRFSVVISSRYR
jgi:hypothetical protein